jgi:hypothetical protein
VCVCVRMRVFVHDVKLSLKSELISWLTKNIHHSYPSRELAFTTWITTFFNVRIQSYKLFKKQAVVYLKHWVIFMRRKVKIEIAVMLKELRSSFVSLMKT